MVERSSVRTVVMICMVESRWRSKVSSLLDQMGRMLGVITDI